MDPIQDQLAQEMAAEIVRLISPQRIILFGSRARGDARADSDVDLLIVQDRPFTPEQSRYKQMGYLWRRLARFRVPKDILIYTPAEIAIWRDSKNHVIGYALREGRLLYERA